MVHGAHHVTAMAKDPVATRRFYERILGLRLVKRTVNFDDSGAHHLYFGDRVGSPGTLLTFFPSPTIAPGRRGSGEVGLTTLAAPEGSLGFWRDRLERAGLEVERQRRGDEDRLLFADPSGMRLGVVEADMRDDDASVWTEAEGIDATRALRGVHSVSLRVARPQKTEAILTDLLGMRRTDARGEAAVLRAATGDLGAVVEIEAHPDAEPARLGGGSVHHVAWRAPDGCAHEDLRAGVERRGLRVTPVLDRKYFRSIYFREPSGVLFEIATDGPGFFVDEEEATLGKALRLPESLESRREEIERTLPALDEGRGRG